MKKTIFIFILFLTCLLSCHKQTVVESKPIATENQSISNDSLIQHVIMALLDSNRRMLEVKDELLMLLDTLQQHATYYPREEVRVDAKSCAGTLLQLIRRKPWTFHACQLYSPDPQIDLENAKRNIEEIYFSLDVIDKLCMVEDVWYVHDSVNHSVDSPLLSNVCVMCDSNATKHCLNMRYYATTDDEFVEIVLPDDANDCFIAFTSAVDEPKDINAIGKYRRGRYGFVKKNGNGSYVIMFGKNFVDAMNKYKFLYIGYADTNMVKFNKGSYNTELVRLESFQDAYSMIHTKR